MCEPLLGVGGGGGVRRVAVRAYTTNRFMVQFAHMRANGSVPRRSIKFCQNRLEKEKSMTE